MFKGMIIFWYGTVALIPHGWRLCDGTNGTPRLVNSHVVGAGGSYAVGANGRETLHRHMAHASHYHVIEPGSDILDGAGKSYHGSYENPLISSDYTEHLPPFYAVLTIQKL